MRYLLLILFPTLALSQGWYYAAPAAAAAAPRISTFLGGGFGHSDSNSTAGPGPQLLTTDQSPLTLALSGDLVVVIAWARTAAIDIYTTQTAGQTWDTTQPPIRAASFSGQMMWCKFNGSWTTDVSMQSASGTDALTVGMWIWRPADGASHVWAIDGTQDTGRVAAPADSLVTIATKSSSVDSTVSIAFYGSPDDNTWVPGTGAPWTTGLSGAEITGHQNISGSDLSGSLIYLIDTTSGSTGTVVRKQSLKGTDPTGYLRIIFK